jgi:hypothetical protein
MKSIDSLKCGKVYSTDEIDEEFSNEYDAWTMTIWSLLLQSTFRNNIKSILVKNPQEGT